MSPSVHKSNDKLFSNTRWQNFSSPWYVCYIHTPPMEGFLSWNPLTLGISHSERFSWLPRSKRFSFFLNNFLQLFFTSHWLRIKIGKRTLFKPGYWMFPSDWSPYWTHCLLVTRDLDNLSMSMRLSRSANFQLKFSGFMLSGYIPISSYELPSLLKPSQRARTVETTICCNFNKLSYSHSISYCLVVQS